VAYGCWFWPLLAPMARGSGVWLNVGRTLVFETRTAVGRWCKKPRLIGFPAGVTGNWHNPNLTAADVAGPGGQLRRDKLGRQSDNSWAVYARELGYDSIQILHGLADRVELIVTTPECTIPGNGKWLRTCPPRATELRSGFDAQKVCTCLETVRLNETVYPLTFSNCAQPMLRPVGVITGDAGGGAPDGGRVALGVRGPWSEHPLLPGVATPAFAKLALPLRVT
jgi:hypothetical protein